MKTEHDQYNQYDQYLHAEYPDLLAENPDARLVSLVRDLDAACALVPPPAHLSASIRQAVRSSTQQTKASPGRASLLHRRLLSVSWIPWFGRAIRMIGQPAQSGRRSVKALALLAAVLFLMGAGYAALPALERLFQAHTGTGAIISGNLGRQVNISRTVDGFTVAVRRVYADPNHVVIGLTISGPQGRTFNSIMPWGEYYGYDPQKGLGTSPVLTDKSGKEFSGGMGGEQGGVQDGAVSYLLDYEGTGIGSPGTDFPKEITAQLRIGMLWGYESLGDDKYRDIFARGPFLFDLTIPVEPGQVADLHQTVEAGGHKVTLERVVTAPTGTRISLRGAGPNADLRLVVDGVTYRFQQPDGQAIPFRWTADSLWEYVSGTSLQDKQGEWELIVGPGVPVPSDIDPSPTRLEGGPWTFKFAVPPAPPAAW